MTGLIRHGDKGGGGGGVWRWEVGEGRDAYRYAITTRMTEPFECFIHCERQSRKTVSANHNVSEEK